MQLPSAPLLLLLLTALPAPFVAALHSSAPAEYPPPVRKDSPEEPILAPGENQQTNPSPGTADAPVDGLDGKPHDGPWLKDAEKGSGDTGISSGNPHIDITKPPPHTGDYEIVNLEENDLHEGTDSHKQQALGDDASSTSPDSSSPPPSSDRDHKEYKQSGTDTLTDPPVDSPPLDSAPSEGEGISTPLHSFSLSFIMIIFSEIGDKTFLIAALMAMKHPRFLVFTAALSSLIVMSILSAVLGHAVPTLIPKTFTSFLASGLFLVFGVRMIIEGLQMEKGTGNVQEELKEVEQELEEKAGRHRASSISHNLESGLISPNASRGLNSHSLRRSTSSPSLSDSDEDDYERARGKSSSGKGGKMISMEGIQNLAGLLLSPAWVQTFVMTFLGEWGDRSQIATIAMAAGQDYWYVTIGAISGHSICTGIAVVGGRMLASRISVRNVTLGGAGAFLVFGIIYLAEALYF